MYNYVLWRQMDLLIAAHKSFSNGGIEDASGWHVAP